MKNLKNLFSLIAVAAVLLFAAQACKKASAEDNIAQVEASEQEGESIVSEEWLDTQVDEIYESEVGTPSVTIGTSGVTLATDADGDASCAATPTFKYKDQYIVGTAGSTLSLTLGASCIVDSIVNTNSKSGKNATDADAAKIGGKLVFSDLSNSTTPSTAVTVKLAQAEAGFKTGSAKMTVYMRVKLKDTSSTYTEKKSKSVTVKVVGKNASNKLYGTNAWGLLASGVSTANLTAAGTTIDSASFVPTKGDVIIFGADKFRGVIDSVSAPTTSTKNGIKYKFYYTAWNAKADCKSSRARKSVSKYAYTFKPSGVIAPTNSTVTDYPAIFLGPDGSTKATKFVR